MAGRTITLKDQYFSWLYKLVGKQRRGYKKLAQKLHSVPFEWSVHNDDNRCDDGIKLRDIFVEENHLDVSHLEVKYFLKGECTIFEVLVALAQRINDLMFDLKNQNDHTSKWFLEMIRNLGLDAYTDDTITSYGFTKTTERKIDGILETFVDRTYDYYGTGGLFPLKRKPPEDQRKIEIWYQLMRYLVENYE